MENENANERIMAYAVKLFFELVKDQTIKNGTLDISTYDVDIRINNDN